MACVRRAVSELDTTVVEHSTLAQQSRTTHAGLTEAQHAVIREHVATLPVRSVLKGVLEDLRTVWGDTSIPQLQVTRTRFGLHCPASIRCWHCRGHVDEYILSGLLTATPARAVCLGGGRSHSQGDRRAEKW